MSRNWRLYLQDMADCSRKIVLYTAGTTFESFLSDVCTYDAVVRNLEIIGEAAKEELRTTNALPVVLLRQAFAGEL